MTAYKPAHAFDVAPGEPQPSLLALVFRPLLRLAWRKPAAPEASPPTPSGAATAAFPCCECCECCDGCGDEHTEPCEGGCNDAEPVLGDQMLSDVRRQCDTGQLAKIHPAPHLPPERPTLLARPDGVIMIDERHAIDVQPVRAPVYGQVPVAEVIAAEDAAMAAEADRAAYVRAQMSAAMWTRDPAELRRVLDGLRAMPTAAGPELAERVIA